MSNRLFAGAARVVINPPLGIKRPGIRIFRDPIQAIESDLTATAVVLANGPSSVALIAVDLLFMSMPVITALRGRIADALGTPRSHVLVNFSHTHGGPTFPDFIDDTPEQIDLQRRYQTLVEERFVAVAVEAQKRLQPARIGAGRGECHIGIYRRAKTETGRDVLGEVPGAPIDPSVGVIRVDDLEGQPIATLFSYGCHPVTVGPRALVASSDFPGAARRVVETSLGGLSLFLQACAGNINPVWGLGYEVDCRDTKNRTGMMLGGEVIQVAAQIRTHVRRGPKTPIGPVANILLWPWVPVAGDTCSHLSAVEEVVQLELGPLPSLEHALAIQEKWNRKWSDDLARGARDWDLNYSARFVHWSRKLVQAVKDGHPTLDVVIQGIRVNDIAICGIGVESFFETGLALKARSGFAHTEVLGYTNGCAAYLPRAEDYPPGGWDIDEQYAVPDLFFQSYSLPVALRTDSEQRVVTRAAAVLQRLA